MGNFYQNNNNLNEMIEFSKYKLTNKLFPSILYSFKMFENIFSEALK